MVNNFISNFINCKSKNKRIIYTCNNNIEQIDLLKDTINKLNINNLDYNSVYNLMTLYVTYKYIIHELDNIIYCTNLISLDKPIFKVGYKDV